MFTMLQCETIPVLFFPGALTYPLRSYSQVCTKSGQFILAVIYARSLNRVPYRGDTDSLS